MTSEVTYAHYEKTLRCRSCTRILVDEKPRAGCRIFRRCCIGPFDVVFIAWKNPEEAAQLEETFRGLLGTTRELEFINEYAYVEETDT